MNYSYLTRAYNIRQVHEFAINTHSQTATRAEGIQLHLPFLFRMPCCHTDSFLLVQLYLGFIMMAIRLTVVHCFPL